MRCSRLTVLFLLLALPSTCLSWPAKVVSVADGDTIKVLRDGRQVKVRLYGIDSPEKGQAFYPERLCLGFCRILPGEVLR